MTAAQLSPAELGPGADVRPEAAEIAGMVARARAAQQTYEQFDQRAHGWLKVALTV